MTLNKNGMPGAPARRALWKAQADTGRADYFRWTFKTVRGNEIVLSVGKKYKPRNVLCHAASADTSEVLLWDKRSPRVDLMPSDVMPLLSPWDRFFSGDRIACNMPDSIVNSLIFGLTHYLNKPHEHKAIIL